MAVRPGLVVPLGVASVVVSFAAGYAVAQVGGPAGDPEVPLAVVCGATLGSLGRLAEQADGGGVTTVDAEVTVLSQQRLRLAEGEQDARGDRLAGALDAAVLSLAAAREGEALAEAVTASRARVRNACPVP